MASQSVRNYNHYADANEASWVAFSNYGNGEFCAVCDCCVIKRNFYHFQLVELVCLFCGNTLFFRLLIVVVVIVLLEQETLLRHFCWSFMFGRCLIPPAFDKRTISYDVWSIHPLKEAKTILLLLRFFSTAFFSNAIYR